MEFAKRMDSVSSNILHILDEKQKELRRKGREVFNLSIGTPDFRPDAHVMEAVSKAALDPQNYKYSIADLPELIEAVQNWYKRRYAVDLEKDEVMSVYGSQEGIAHIAFPICDPGDIVITVDPGYAIFSFGPFLAGAQLHKVPLLKENDFLIDFDAIDPEVARKAKLLIVSYPNNPVTAMATPEFYEKLIAFAKKYDIIVLHDNAYSELIYDCEPGPSFLSFPGAKEVGVEFNSLSKSYNLTGARISFVVGNAEVIRRFKALRSQIDYGIFYPVQFGAIAALNGPQDILERNRAGYKARRDALCQGLRDIGWDVPDSMATMFTWFPLPKGFTNSVDFAMELLERTGVVCVPGSSFGELGEGYVRMALVLPVEELERAIQKIAESGILQK